MLLTMSLPLQLIFITSHTYSSHYFHIIHHTYTAHLPLFQTCSPVPLTSVSVPASPFLPLRGGPTP
jgi:hypothetical protein